MMNLDTFGNETVEIEIDTTLIGENEIWIVRWEEEDKSCLWRKLMLSPLTLWLQLDQSSSSPENPSEKFWEEI